MYTSPVNNSLKLVFFLGAVTRVAFTKMELNFGLSKTACAMQPLSDLRLLQEAELPDTQQESGLHLRHCWSICQLTLSLEEMDLNSLCREVKHITMNWFISGFASFSSYF